ncbi:hypothetical protein V6N13_033970 [Hibiscus sabdariffa]
MRSRVSCQDVVQSRVKEPVDETPVEPKYDEVESHSTVKKESANKKVYAKQQPNSSKTLAKSVEPAYVYDSDDCQVDDKLESILRMDLAQLCQEMNDASNDNSDEKLEETIKDEQ